MRFSLIARKAGPIAPFKRSGRRFDQLFPAEERSRKAWDGQDKDKFFREKYAHVHAKQIARRKEEQSKSQERYQGTRKYENNGYQQTNRRENDMLPRRNVENLSFSDKLAQKLRIHWRMEFVYGTNALHQVIPKRKIDKLLTSFKSIDEIDPKIAELVNANNISVDFSVPKPQLDVMSGGGVHNGYVCQTEKLDIPLVSSINKGKLGLYLDRINDPHNFGAILRTALWYGCDFVAYPPSNCAQLTPAVVKSSSGASEHLNLNQVDKPLTFFDNMRAQGWNILTAAETSSNQLSTCEPVDPDELQALRSEKPLMLVMGNENKGVRTQLLMRSTHSTYLKSQQKDISSLNVSVATSILLDRICRK